MATAVATTVSVASEGDVTSGRVKWFNNKAGYGFISVPDCETGEERDMFVHHSEIKVEQSQYKYLVQGEYVEFIIAPINRENKIDVHATSVRGINGGKLMCETRNEVRSYRTLQGSAQQGEGQESRPQGQGPRPQSARPSSGPRQTSDTRPQDKRPQDKRPQTARPQDNRPRRATSSSEPRQTAESKRPQLDKADQTEWMVVPRRRAETMSRADNVSRADTVTVKSKSQPPRQRQPEIEIA